MLKLWAEVWNGNWKALIGVRHFTAYFFGAHRHNEAEQRTLDLPAPSLKAPPDGIRRQLRWQRPFEPPGPRPLRQRPDPPDVRDFRLMDRRVMDALCALPGRDRFMKGLYGWVGFRSIAVPIELEPRQNGTSKFGFVGLFRLALTGLASFTNWPLRMWTGIGMAIASLSILYRVWIALRTLFFGVDVQGWSTLVVAVCLLGGVQLISIGVLGEYLSRVFMEVKGRPGSIIAEETVSEGLPESWSGK